MPGNSRRGLALQERDLHLLRELAVTRVIDRELAKIIAGFGSTTRANARLLTLVRARLLRRFSMGAAQIGHKFLYSLSSKGARFVGDLRRGLRRRNGDSLVADLVVEHQLAINSIYVSFRYQPIPIAGVSFVRWLNFFEPVSPGTRLIPDGYAELSVPQANTLSAFVEVDLGHENLSVWKHKVERYVQFAVSGDFARRFGQGRFRVLVLARSERRLQSLRKATAAITDRVFWFTTLDSVKRAGLFGPVWFRPMGVERLPLIGTP